MEREREVKGEEQDEGKMHGKRDLDSMVSSFLSKRLSQSEVETKRTKDEGNAPESMHAGRVFRGQVVPCSKNFCRGVDLPPSTGHGEQGTSPFLSITTTPSSSSILLVDPPPLAVREEERKNGEPGFE